MLLMLKRAGQGKAMHSVHTLTCMNIYSTRGADKIWRDDPYPQQITLTTSKLQAKWLAYIIRLSCLMASAYHAIVTMANMQAATSNQHAPTETMPLQLQRPPTMYSLSYNRDGNLGKLNNTHCSDISKSTLPKKNEIYALRA